ncbi:hypothetical protein CASFOL_006032 [Castilleja foliolosa]|uniref:Uncharacterized protein n=1 Tax=Castilleja foliolosa TaxID=1961234 RepID=A0ABD3E952_9LAMI
MALGIVGKKPIGTNPDDEEEVSEEEGILITKAPNSSSSNSGDDDGDPNGPRPFKCNMPNCKDDKRYHNQSPHALRNHFFSKHDIFNSRKRFFVQVQFVL